MKSRAAQSQPSRAERLECGELAPAPEQPGATKAGASSTHSKRFATKQAPKILAAALLLVMLCIGNAHAQSPPAGTGPGKRAGPRVGPITKIAVTITNRAGIEQLIRSGYDVDQVRSN